MNEKSPRDPAVIADLEKLVECFTYFCQKVHPDRPREPFTLPVSYGTVPAAPLCPECRGLFAYAAAKRLKCPLCPKPSCRRCPSPCYDDEKYRAMGVVMRTWGLGRMWKKLLGWLGW